MENREDLKPPSWVIRFLKWICPQHLFEEIEGDLLQKFHNDLQSPGHSKWPGDYKLRRAKRRLIWNVIRFIRPGIVLRNKFSIELNQGMYRSYFKIMRRNMIKQ